MCNAGHLLPASGHLRCLEVSRFAFKCGGFLDPIQGSVPSQGFGMATGVVTSRQEFATLLSQDGGDSPGDRVD